MRSPRRARITVEGRTLLAERVRHGMTVKPDSLVVVVYTLWDEAVPDFVCSLQYVVPEAEDDRR